MTNDFFPLIPGHGTKCIINVNNQIVSIGNYDAIVGIGKYACRKSQALAQTKRSRKSMAVCYLDLDGFKIVNDLYGHDAGDQLLIEISHRIKDCLRNGDTVARIGGDEFVLILLELNKESECDAILERMLLSVAEPVTLHGNKLGVSASLGFTIFPDDASDAETLMRHADQAMYVAKQSGKNRFHRFDPQLDRITLAHGELIAQIESGLDNHEFVLFFQPKVNMRSGEIIGNEALIRWNHPRRGLLSPMDFLPAINDSDLIIKLGDWVLRHALECQEIWAQQGIKTTISVNVAPRHLLQDDFTLQLKTHLAQHPNIDPNFLELEILETAALEDIGKVSEVMRECQKLGVSFALDDFGTGYSSLTYLKSLPAQTLKIDQSFIRDMLNDTEDLAIVEAIINLTQIFHREVIAEGVETIVHGQKLLSLGCDYAQGYGIAKPMPFKEVAAWMALWNQKYKRMFI